MDAVASKKVSGANANSQSQKADSSSDSSQQSDNKDKSDGIKSERASIRDENKTGDAQKGQNQAGQANGADKPAAVSKTDQADLDKIKN